MNSTTRMAMAVTAAVGALALAATSAEAAIPNPDPTGTHTGRRINPTTGQSETARVTDYPDITIRPNNTNSSLTLAPAPGTGGLYLRSAGGAIKGLMGEGDRARFIACHPSNPNLALVEQITSGHGGFGAYKGYVKVSATSAPRSLPCG
ncbi:hypothetical protein [Streptomyces lydicus]|uniref:hypothetical protein n=1 Tax=Streptomyces lydicus TaxID=47763 RepID=UPI001010A40D|nr:hypothetical protein [Streptomyces lydicus]MCZ1012100.1 hypothetical protein [Streptomyces lydicus]